MKLKDIGVLSSVILIVAMLVIPFPTWLLRYLNYYQHIACSACATDTMNMQEPSSFQFSHLYSYC